jgi:hypothetical protein
MCNGIWSGGAALAAEILSHRNTERDAGDADEFDMDDDD